MHKWEKKGTNDPVMFNRATKHYIFRLESHALPTELSRLVSVF